MNISENGINLIKKFEGCSLSAYRCPRGVWTIGWGHTGCVKQGDRITQEKADELLKKDLKVFEAHVSNIVKIPVTQNQFDALVSFEYNVGYENFSKSTLLKLLNQGKYKEAAQQFERWKYAGGKVLAGLERRRQAEKNLFLG